MQRARMHARATCIFRSYGSQYRSSRKYDSRRPAGNGGTATGIASKEPRGRNERGGETELPRNCFGHHSGHLFATRVIRRSCCPFTANAKFLERIRILSLLSIFSLSLSLSFPRALFPRSLEWRERKCLRDSFRAIDVHWAARWRIPDTSVPRNEESLSLFSLGDSGKYEKQEKCETCRLRGFAFHRCCEFASACFSFSSRQVCSNIYRASLKFQSDRASFF